MTSLSLWLFVVCGLLCVDVCCRLVCVVRSGLFCGVRCLLLVVCCLLCVVWCGVFVVVIDRCALLSALLCVWCLWAVYCEMRIIDG